MKIVDVSMSASAGQTMEASTLLICNSKGDPVAFFDEDGDRLEIVTINELARLTELVEKFGLQPPKVKKVK